MSEDKQVELTDDEEDKAVAVLKQLARAHQLIILAAEQLCFMPGFNDEWQECFTVGSAVSSYFHHIEARLKVLKGVPSSTP